MAICDKCNHNGVCGFQDDTTLACNHFQKEVVRCKDCMHWLTGYCNYFAYYSYEPMTNEDDFCSYGERREGE